jgi:hypothetical protein
MQADPALPTHRLLPASNEYPLGQLDAGANVAAMSHLLA